MQVDLITHDDLLRMTRDLMREIKEIKAMVSARSKEQGTDWVKSTEVQKLLKISKGTLQSMRLNGTIAYSKVGGVLYYAMSDIEALLQSRKTQNN